MTKETENKDGGSPVRSNDLLPCPFCGRDDNLSRRNPDCMTSDSYVVRCHWCSAMVMAMNSQEYTDKLWNTRVAR